MDFREALLQEMQNQKTKLVENKQRKDEAKVVEDTEEYLEPRFDSRASFYKKAKVVTKDNGDEELYSYNTHVGGIRGGKPYTKGNFSQTTSRHQKDYFRQRGFDPKEVELEEDKKGDYLSLSDLTPDQKSELKQRYLSDKYDEEGKTPSYGELADADNLVSDEDLENEFGGVSFTADDFACSAGQDLEESKVTEARALDYEAILDIVAKDIIPNLDLIIENGDAQGLSGLVALCEDTKSLLAHGLGELGYYDNEENN